MLPLLFACVTATDSAEPDSADSGDTAAQVDTADTADTAEGEGPVFEDLGLRLGLPSYVYPGTADWTSFSAGAGATGGFVLLNPDSGPGPTANDDYVAGADEARAAGALVLGYVPTGYGARAAEDVDLDVQKYHLWYGVDGVLFDEVPSDCDTWAPWYAERTTSAEGFIGADALVVYNPGTESCPAYLDDADVLVLIEERGPALLDSGWAAPAWVADYAPERFWMLVHSTPSDRLGQVLGLARDSGAAWVYVTDGLMPNPWDRTPLYWDDEVAAVEAQ